MGSTSQTGVVNAFLEAIYSHTNDAILLSDDQQQYLRVNPAASAMFGYTEQELLSMRVYDLLDDEQLGVEGLWDQFIREGTQTGIVRLKRKDGKQISCHYNAKANVMPGVHLSILTDISERVKLEEELAQREELFRTTFEHSGIGMALVNLDSTYKEVNQSLCDILGYTRDELLGMRFLDVTSAEDAAEDRHLMNVLYSGQEKVICREKRYRHKSGREIWASLRVSALRDSSGRFVHFIAQVEDVTDSKKAREQLEVNEQRYRSLFERNPAAVFSLNARGYFTSANQTTLRLTGLTLEQLCTRKYTDFCMPDDRARLEALFSKAGRGYSYNFEVTAVVRDQRKVDLSITNMPVVVDDQISGIYCIAHDITIRRRKREERLLIETISGIFREERNLEEALRLALYELSKIGNIAVAEAWINRFDDDWLFLTTRHCAAALDYWDERKAFKSGEGLVGMPHATGGPYFIKNIQEAQQFVRKDFALRNGLKSGLSIPVLYNKELIAVLVFLSERPAQRPDDILNLSENMLTLLAGEIKRKKAEATFKRFFDLSPDLLVIVGIDGTFKRVSPTFHQELGYSTAELKNHHVLEYVHPEDREDSRLELQKLANGTPVVEFENRLVARNGEAKWFSWSAVSNQNDGLIVGTGRNITDKVMLERIVKEEQERFSRMFNEAPVSMCILKGPDHVFVSANREYYKLTGRTDAIIGQPVRQVFPEVEGQGYFDWLDKVYREGETFSSDESKLRLNVQGDGQLREIYISFMYQPYLNGQGAIEGIFYFGVDVTEQVLARRRIEESEQRFRVFFEQAAVGVAMVESQTGRIRKVNRKYCEIFGYSADELLGMTFMDFTFPEDLQADLDNMSRLIKDEIHEFAMEKRHIHKDGSVVWTHLTVSPMWKPGEEPELHIAIVKDITERKLAEQRIRKSEKKYIDLVEQLPVAVYTCDSTGRVLLYNKCAKDLWGAEPPDGENAWCGSFKMLDEHGDALPHEQCPMAITIKEGRPVRDRVITILRPNGEQRNIIPYPSPVFDDFGKVIGGVNVLIDITERREAEEKIKASEQMLEQTQQLAKIGGWEWDVVQNKVTSTHELYRIYGLEPGATENSFDSFFQFTHPDDKDAIQRQIQQALYDCKPFECYCRIIRTDGAVRNLKINGEVETNASGTPLKMRGVTADVTDQLHTQEELHKLSLIARRTTDAVIITTPSGTIDWVNNAFTRLTGFRMQEVQGKKISKLLYGPETSADVCKYIEEQITNHQSFRCEILEYDKKGKPFWVNIQGHPMVNDKGELVNYFNIETDITERKKAFEELQTKENAIRNFASHLNDVLEDERARISREIHDEFGQQLTGLKMSLSSVLKTANDAAAKSTLKEMVSSVDETIYSLRKFANELRPIVLDSLGLTASIQWLGREFESKAGIPSNVELQITRTDFGRDVATVFFRVCQEALTNVMKHSTATEVWIKLEEVDEQLKLHIVDNGQGMRDERNVGSTTLGFAGMRERANLINARLKVSSEPGRGTHVQLEKDLSVPRESL